MGLGRERAHVGVVTHGVHAAFLGSFLRAGGILVLGDDVAAHVQEGLGGFLFRGRIVPGLGPDYAYLYVGVHGLCAEGEGVDAADDFGDGEGRHVAEHVGLAHGARDHAGQITRLIDTAEIVGHVFGVLVAGAVQELDLGKILGHFEHGIHVAVAGREDDIKTLAGHVQDDALGILAFSHGLDERGGHAVQGFHGQAALVMGVGISGVAHRGHIDKTDLQIFGKAGRSQSQKGQQKQGQTFTHHPSSVVCFQQRGPLGTMPIGGGEFQAQGT